jgi:hypothetical protein
MKTTFRMSILALSVALMTVVSSCTEEKKPDEANVGIDTTSKVEVKTVDTTKTVTPDSTASSSTTTTEVKKEEKAK